VVEKELGEEAQVLAVDLVLAAVHLEHAQAPVAVDFVPGRVAQLALAHVTLKSVQLPHVLQAELAQIQTFDTGKVFGVGGVVPSVDVEVAYLDAHDVLHLGRFQVLLLQSCTDSVLRVIILLRVVQFVVPALLVARLPPALPVVDGRAVGRSDRANTVLSDPLVEPPVLTDERHVILRTRPFRADLDYFRHVLRSVSPPAHDARADFYVG